ncbi:MAG TPA: NADH-ubiquinone oxidoreductase-F iron-sulfur binding region domain-containing protein [Bacteroidales bacterium]|nr:NADH-ubiquinone oxidoreductase-F iron-sulfur binding region domain-containing protein [Bacteroidales bacterium]
MKPEDTDNIKRFLISEVLFSPEAQADPSVARELSYICRERVFKPMVYVGMGSCGVIAGAGKVFETIRQYIDDQALNVDLIAGGCLGFCSAEPIVDVQLPGKARISFGNVTVDKVSHILDEVLNHCMPQNVNVLGQYASEIFQNWEGIPNLFSHSFFSSQNRILMDNCGLIDPVSIHEYIARGGYKAFAKSISFHTPAAVCQEVEDSLLAGRGGGAFPVGKKWRLVLNAVSGQKYFICNAVESDPGSYMNRAIIESNPHRLIEAILIGAYAIGATKAFVFIRKEFKLATERFEKALNNAREFGLIGHHILESGVNIEITLIKGARAFVCGEETALINSVEGKRAMPDSKPPFPSERGLWNKPTIVNNVETLFNVPLILQNGADWYKAIGTEKSKGTKLFTLSGKVQRSGIIEVPMGISFREIVNKISGGTLNGKRFKAIFLGINSGNFITENTIDVRVDFDEMMNIGAALGSGGFVVVDETACMVDMAKYFTGFFQRESCGKCIPCREGTARMLEIMQLTTKRPGKRNKLHTLERFKGVMQLRTMASVIKETSLCALGRSAPNAIINTLQSFKSEFESHLYDRKCPAGVCSDLRVFSIDVEKCTGCTACYKKCPVEAIIGSPRVPHFVVEDRCTGCGFCYDACKFNAVMIY